MNYEHPHSQMPYTQQPRMSYGQQAQQQRNLPSMQPTSMNYYNSNQQQQQMMLNPRKCSAIVSPGQQMMMMNQRKCSTVIAPDHSQTFASSSQHQTGQISSSSTMISSQNFLHSPQQMMQISPNQAQQISSNQMMQISPDQQGHLMHHKNSIHLPIEQQQQRMIQGPSPVKQNNSTQQPMIAIQQQQQDSQYNIEMNKQHKYSSQHQNSIPSSHISPQMSNGLQASQLVSSSNQPPLPPNHMTIQHQSSLSQPNMNNMGQCQQSNILSTTPYNPLKDCTSAPRIQNYNKMDTQFNNSVDFDSSVQQQYPFGHQRFGMLSNSSTIGINGQQCSSYDKTQGQQQVTPLSSALVVNNQQRCDPHPAASDNCSIYPRATDDYYHRQTEQSWRKASLACNFRLNPTRKYSSVSPNFVSNSYSSDTLQSNRRQQFNRTPDFDDASKFKDHSNSNTFSAHHRSQSLSATEFLRRRGQDNSTSNWASQQTSSLRRFSSQLRTHKPSNAGICGNKSAALLYTPPPMLSPMRSGSGLYRSISRQERKISSLVQSLKQMDGDLNSSDQMASMGPPPDSIPTVSTPVVRKTSALPLTTEQTERKKSSKVPLFTDTLEMEQARASLTGRKPFIRPPMDNRANAPQRKNGLFLSGAARGPDVCAFAAELEALRKESASSTQSNQDNASRRMSIVKNSKLSLSVTIPPNHEEVLRKLSNASIDENTRKISSTSDTYYDYVGLDSDITPHINLGKTFQARVKKWSPREISDEEREAIPDRDDIVFDNKVIEHIPQRAVAAYEALACSQAVPRPGRNKELALHILMENQGNLQAAVMDLLRSDTLDWEQYPIIYNNLYVDVDSWSPEEITSFQDAIYKSEKDFHQVSSELGNRSVKQCVAFYYSWKKCCPDDYRKLRNLRRKRLLLEQQLDYSTLTDRQRLQSENPITSGEESDGLDSDNTSIASANLFNRPYSPNEDAPRGEKHPRLAFGSPPGQIKPPSQHFGQQPHHFGEKVSDDHSNQTTSAASNFPWLHGEFPSPVSSNANSSYSQPPSVGSMAMDVFNADNPGVVSNTHQKTHRTPANKKGAQPSADGFFHCRLCDKRFEKVKSLNAHMKSHAMKARAEAEANAQIQSKQQQHKQIQLPPQQSPLQMALGAAVRLQSNFPTAGHPHPRAHEEVIAEEQQNQQQAFLRLFGGHNPFQTAQQLAANDAAVSQAMSQLSAAQQFSVAFGQQHPDLQNVLAQIPPTTQTTLNNQNAAVALEHLQQNHLQHSATIMH